ncbi:hypothetical protein [Thiobacillus sp.]
MWPPLLQLLLNEPALLAEHAAAYSALIRQDAAHWQARLVRRLGYLLVMGVGILLALIFSGTALMLYAVTEVSHWLLWTLPLLPLVSAVIAAWRLWRDAPEAPPFMHVRSQVVTDLQLFGGKEP